MEKHNGSTSVWMASATTPHFSNLMGDVEVDVCVIGAGIAGLTTAYLLSTEGKNVALIEAMEVGAGETGRSAAHFFPPDERYVEIERGFGTEQAQLVADVYKQTTDMVESIVRKEHIDCSFERLDGYLFSLKENIQAKQAEIFTEAAAARRLGVEVEILDGVPDLSFDTGSCVRFLNQAQFHPLNYLNGLAQAFVANGGNIFTQTRALKIQGDRAMQSVQTEHGTVHAQAVVVATNTPFNDRVVMHTKQSGYRSYVVGLRVPKNSVPRILMWDTGDPYYYIRLHTSSAYADHDVLMVGGADHKVGQDTHPEHRYAEIETWVRQRYPMAQTVEFKWSGEVMEPSDGLAFLGRNPMDSDNVYIITGDSGNGMTHCTAGAMLITDLIMGRAHPWAELYAPSRKPVHGLSDFIMEQANTLAQYTDWVSGGDVESAQEIAAGQGAILQDGRKKLAVYRDEGGSLHVLSAACTHLGGVVSWNSAEKSWDCPCHASRFDVDGAVLHGPATKALAAETLSRPPHIPPSEKVFKAGEGRESGRESR